MLCIKIALYVYTKWKPFILFSDIHLFNGKGEKFSWHFQMAQMEQTRLHVTHVSVTVVPLGSGSSGSFSQTLDGVKT